MEGRRIGSGTANGEADATAKILAALLNGDARSLRRAKHDFDSASSRRRGLGAGDGRGYSADEIEGLLIHVPPALVDGPCAATACGPGEAGDVLVDVGARTRLHIEIKTQITRPSFASIQNADWVRGPTDFLGAILSKEHGFAATLSDPTREKFVDNYQPRDGWDLEALWVSDVAGAPTWDVRKHLNIHDAHDLVEFTTRKIVIHVTQEGLRMYRLSEVPSVISAFEIGVTYDIEGPQVGSELKIWTRGDADQPRKGTVHLTYYIGQRGRGDGGGHHMSESFFDGAMPLVIVGREVG